MGVRIRGGTRRAGFVVLLLAVTLLGGCSHGLQTPRFARPSESVAPQTPAVRRLRAGAADANLVIIVADAARADHFGAFGYERNTTPHLDSFFGEGILFTEAYATAPNTKASIASLFTAQFPDCHGVLGQTTGLDPEGATLAERMKAAGCTTVGFSANPYLSASFGFARGFDVFYEVFRKVDLKPQMAGRVDGALLVEAALDWLRAHREDRFFAYLHFLEPHFPYTPPSAFRQRLGDREASPDSDEMLAYDANLAYFDHLAGQLLEEMDQLGLLDNSVVVFLSDHGEAFGEHGFYRHEKTVYQEMIRVPVAFRLPSSCRAPSRERAEMFPLTDVMPTLLDLLQVAPPDTMQGRSRLRLLAGEEEPEPAFAVSRSRGEDYTGGVEHLDEVSYALRDPDYTLLLGARGRRVELYHRHTDPAERRNIAQEQPRVVKRLHRQFRSWAATQRARPPVLRGGTVFISETKRVALDDKTRQHLRDLGYLK